MIIILQVGIPSCFVGLALENCKLPFANHGHVVLAEPSPILFWKLLSLPRYISFASNLCRSYLKYVVLSKHELLLHFRLIEELMFQIPHELQTAFISATEKGNMRTMPNRSMPAAPYPTPGALLMGDAFNMRHPLTGGGMTVALSDVILLRDLLRPLHSLDNAYSLCKYFESFYTLRKVTMHHSECSLLATHSSCC